jgi:predicted ATPase
VQELLERERELTAIERALAAARAGAGIALALRGPAGVGKSALVEYACERAAGSRHQVAHVGGEPADLADSFAYVHALFWLAVALSEHRPLVIAVDDAQWIDLASLRFVAHMAAHAGGLPIAVLVAIRSGEEAADPQLLGELERIAQPLLEPRELSADAVHELLRRRFGDDADRLTGALFDSTRETRC